MHEHAVLTNAEMALSDQMAVANGVASLDLMETAGAAVAAHVERLCATNACTVVVLCGPGNNGGDGFVAARLLQSKNFAVSVCCLVADNQLSGDAKVMAERYPGVIQSLEQSIAAIEDADIIVDALFGAGLTRPVAGIAADCITAVNLHHGTVVSVDVPSGLDGDTGVANGPVVEADGTITFFRLKPAHLLLPGRTYCGDVRCVDIGTPPGVIGEIKYKTSHNAPSLWRDALPPLATDGHKYNRGHGVVVSGPVSATGAARLAARAALRTGAGLVTVASPVEALQVNASQLTAVMVDAFASRRGLQSILSDKRKTAVLIGPGRGVVPETCDDVEAVLQSGIATVLDADALTVFASDRVRLKRAIDENQDRPAIITPHDGEFKRLFPDLTGSKLQRARDAASTMQATVVLKGPDTVIATPDGRAAINDNAPPTLATAGSGDVLAGLITGLVAQGMPEFEAACAAVWMHGAAARRFGGAGLIAEDLPDLIPQVLQPLYASSALTAADARQHR